MSDCAAYRFAQGDLCRGSDTCFAFPRTTTLCFAFVIPLIAAPLLRVCRFVRVQPSPGRDCRGTEKGYLPERSAVAAAEENQRKDDEPDAIVVEQVTKTVIHIRYILHSDHWGFPVIIICTSGTNVHVICRESCFWHTTP